MTRDVFKNEFGMKRHKGAKKFFIWGSILFGVFLIGFLIAVIIDGSNEFKKNNVGTFEISLSNSGVVVTEPVRELEFREIKIGQREIIKFNFTLNKVTRDQTYEDVAKTKKIENGVFVRIKLSGEVFDLDKEGKVTNKNHTLSNRFGEIFASSPPLNGNWQKEGKNYYYSQSSEDGSVALVKENDNIYSTEDIMIYFDSNVVNAEWYEKMVKIKIELEAVDHLGSEANSWRY